MRHQRRAARTNWWHVLTRPSDVIAFEARDWDRGECFVMPMLSAKAR